MVRYSTAGSATTYIESPTSTDAETNASQLSFRAGKRCMTILNQKTSDNRRSRGRIGQATSVISELSYSTPLVAPGTYAPKTNYSQDLQRLPVGTVRGDKRLQYVWDGTRIKAVEEDVLRVEGANHAGHLMSWIGQLQDGVRAAFLPNVRDVTPCYWEWLRWRLSQRFFSSTMQNFSTQALLTALGLGAKRTVAASAAINWLLKDGVGRIARMTVATNFGQSFDADLKRLRFVTSLIFTSCISCEFLTPFFPQRFLLLASIANVGKAIGLAAFVSTSPAFQQALCTGPNLSDLTAKNQAQHMMVDMVSLAMSAALTYATRNMEGARLYLPLCAFPICAVGDLVSIYRELKSVQLRTLNRERAEMLAERWLRGGKVATAAQISESEHLLAAPDVCGGFLPLSIVPLEQLVTTPEELMRLLQQYGGEKYMLTVRHPPVVHRGPLKLPWHSAKPKVLISLSDDAKASDALGAILEAGYLRQLAQDVHLAVKEAHQPHSHQAGSLHMEGSNPPRPAQVLAGTSWLPAQNQSARTASLWQAADSLTKPGTQEQPPTSSQALQSMSQHALSGSNSPCEPSKQNDVLHNGSCKEASSTASESSSRSSNAIHSNHHLDALTPSDAAAASGSNRQDELSSTTSSRQGRHRRRHHSSSKQGCSNLSGSVSVGQAAHGGNGAAMQAGLTTMEVLSPAAAINAAKITNQQGLDTDNEDEGHGTFTPEQVTSNTGALGLSSHLQESELDGVAQHATRARSSCAGSKQHMHVGFARHLSEHYEATRHNSSSSKDQAMAAQTRGGSGDDSSSNGGANSRSATSIGNEVQRRQDYHMAEGLGACKAGNELIESMPAGFGAGVVGGGLAVDTSYNDSANSGDQARAAKMTAGAHFGWQRGAPEVLHTHGMPPGFTLLRALFPKRLPSTLAKTIAPKEESLPKQQGGEGQAHNNWQAADSVVQGDNDHAAEATKGRWFRKMVKSKLGPHVLASATGLEATPVGQASMKTVAGSASPVLWQNAVPLQEHQWDLLMAQAHEAAKQARSSFIENLHEAGWKTKAVLLSTSEKAGYVTLPNV